MEVKEILEKYYENYDEEGRLLSRHGKVEFVTTMRYVEKYLRPGMDDATYDLFLKYQLATCEREDMIGYSHHTLDILRKKQGRGKKLRNVAL